MTTIYSEVCSMFFNKFFPLKRVPRLDSDTTTRVFRGGRAPNDADSVDDGCDRPRWDKRSRLFVQIIECFFKRARLYRKVGIWQPEPICMIICTCPHLIMWYNNTGHVSVIHEKIRSLRAWKIRTAQSLILEAFLSLFFFYCACLLFLFGQFPTILIA